jgi:hypothetical protein
MGDLVFLGWLGGLVAGIVGLLSLGCANPAYDSDLFALFFIAACARGVWAGGLFDAYFGWYAGWGMDCRASLAMTGHFRHCEAVGRGDPSLLRRTQGLPRWARNDGGGDFHFSFVAHFAVFPCSASHSCSFSSSALSSSSDGSTSLYLLAKSCSLSCRTE